MAGYRTYDPKRVAAFLRVRDPFGAFSNMAIGSPMTLHGTAVPSSEALYQALRFPHPPDFQREILDQPAPILSKRHAYARITNALRPAREARARLLAAERYRGGVRLSFSHA